MCYTREIPPVEPRKGSYFLKNLTYLTRWPQPAAILLVKICKNPVFGVAKLQEPNLGPTQHPEIDSEPKSSQNSSQQHTEIDIEPKSSQ